MFEITGDELKPLGRRYKGVLIQQSKHIPSVFLDFLKETKPKRILEIGSSFGGMSMLLRDILDFLNLDSQIISIDIRDRKQQYQNVSFVIWQIFDKDFKLTDSNIGNFIRQDGVTIVMCDGGNKVKEFNELCKHIKSGDFIMAHDYAESISYFLENMKNKLWNGVEITERGIAQCSKENNLQFYMKDRMSSIAWVCKRKS